jgi:hypothetical protein
VSDLVLPRFYRPFLLTRRVGPSFVGKMCGKLHCDTLSLKACRSGVKGCWGYLSARPTLHPSVRCVRAKHSFYKAFRVFFRKRAQKGPKNDVCAIGDREFVACGEWGWRAASARTREGARGAEIVTVVPGATNGGIYGLSGLVPATSKLRPDCSGIGLTMCGM